MKINSFRIFQSKFSLLIAIYIALLFLWLSFLGASSVPRAQTSNAWSRIDLNAIRISAMTARDTSTNIYASSRDAVGVRLGSNDGRSWLPYNDGLTTKDIETLAFCDSGYLFAGSWGDGVYRRTTNSSWEPVNAGLLRKFILSLECGPESEIVAGTADQGFFRSKNNGESWTEVNGNLQNKEIFSLLYINSSYYAGTKQGIYVLAANSSSWDSFELSERIVYTIFALDDVLWVGTDQGVHRRNINGAADWEEIDGLNFTVYSLISDSDGRIYAGTQNNGVHRYYKGSWLKYSHGLTLVDTLFSFADNPNQLFAGTDDGIWDTQVKSLPPLTPPTPTPDVTYILLNGTSNDELKLGDKITYTINIKNGSSDLSDVMIENTLPQNLAPYPDQIPAPTGWVMETPTGQPADQPQTLIWRPVTGSLSESEVVEISYRAWYECGEEEGGTLELCPATPTVVPIETVTPTGTLTISLTSAATAIQTSTPVPPGTPTSTPTPPALADTPTPNPPVPTNTPISQTNPTPSPTPTLEPTDLTIVKSGPSTASPNENFSYVLTITNHSADSLSNLVMYDTLPPEVTLIDADGGGSTTLPPHQQTIWYLALDTIEEFKPGESISKTFIVQANIQEGEIVNDLYYVEGETDDGTRIRAFGETPFVTQVMEGGQAAMLETAPSDQARDPAVAPSDQDEMSDLPPSITNEGAVIHWEHEGNPVSKRSNAWTNPDRNYFPILQQYVDE